MQGFGCVLYRAGCDVLGCGYAHSTGKVYFLLSTESHYDNIVKYMGVLFEGCFNAFTGLENCSFTSHEGDFEFRTGAHL